MLILLNLFLIIVILWLCFLCRIWFSSVVLFVLRKLVSMVIGIFWMLLWVVWMWVMMCFC